jgi:hypothetical protein
MTQVEALRRGEEDLKLAVVHYYIPSVMIPPTLRQLPPPINGATISVQPRDPRVSGRRCRPGLADTSKQQQ